MSTSSPPDDRLVSRAASGDGAAFEDIYERYHQPLYRYALSVMRDPQDAQDVLQSTMERALRSVGAQRTSGGLRAWLFSIAHNEAQRTLEKRPDKADGEALLAGGGELRPGAEASALGAGLVGSSADAEAAGRERLRQLMADLESLPSQQRSALVLRELSGLESDEIGTALGISAPAARQSVYEARVALTVLAQGRDMSCSSVQEHISAGDGRRLRGRRMRAHLRDCAICQAFRAGIASRKADLPVLFPPLATAAAAKILSAAAGSADGSAAGATGAQPGGGFLRQHGKATAAATALLLLVLAGALGATRGQSPDPPGPQAGQSVPPAEQQPPMPKSDPPGASPASERPSSPSTPSTPSSLAGYSHLDPAVIALLAEGDSGLASGGEGDDDDGDGDSGDGGSLAFTGLDVLVLGVAGVLLLGLGLLGRRLGARRPA